MKIPVQVKITLALIICFGLGAGCVTIGLLLPTGKYSGEEAAVMIAIGAALLASSAAGLVAKLAGGFRDISDE